MDVRVSTTNAVAAGLVGGLAGAWAMDQFTRVWNKVVPQSQHDSSRRPPLPYSQQEWDSTSRSAALIAKYAVGRNLTDKERRQGAQIVHFTVGAGGGAIYGAVLGRRNKCVVACGAAFGVVLWVVAEELAMSVLGINDPPQNYSMAMHANSLGEHLAYGTTIGLISKALFAIL
jgi:uncharacterized membrane protein YagU involved in acid resistance